ncbi:MAG: adhesin [Hyphomicrobium sp.]|uniref:adhesin n=1 Tax=Hyphomicrobium sp. TaxID=82 RepID=UPI0039E55D6D
MFAFSLCHPAANAARSVVVRFASAAAAVCLAGCASGNATYPTTPAYVAQGPSVQMESDGIPVQAAPSARIRQLPDDPSQPFSPNYGGENPASTVPAQPTVKAANDKPASTFPIPQDLPAGFRKQLVAAVDAEG